MDNTVSNSPGTFNFKWRKEKVGAAVLTMIRAIDPTYFLTDQALPVHDISALIHQSRGEAILADLPLRSLSATIFDGRPSTCINYSNWSESAMTFNLLSLHHRLTRNFCPREMGFILCRGEALEDGFCQASQIHDKKFRCTELGHQYMYTYVFQVFSRNLS
jgi:hypothetical protein